MRTDGACSRAGTKELRKGQQRSLVSGTELTVKPHQMLFGICHLLISTSFQARRQYHPGLPAKAA